MQNYILTVLLNAILLVALLVYLLNKRNYLTLYLIYPKRNSISLLVKGVLVAFAIEISIFCIFIVNGNYEISLIKSGNLLIFVINIIQFVFVSLLEEIFFRGFVYRSILKYGSRLFSILVTNVIFAFIHIIHTGLNLESIPYLFVVFLIGVYLNYSVIKTNSLYFAFGFHFAYNVISGLLFDGDFEVIKLYDQSKILISVLESVMLIVLIKFSVNNKKKDLTIAST